MPKKSSENLFLLIRSLTKNEKGYFKRYSSKHTIDNKNNYILLFDAINKQEKYNEEKVIAELKESINIKHTSALKNYLYKLILESLRAFYSNSSPDVEINNLLHNASVLISKGLYVPAKKILTSAKKLAYESERHNHLLSIINQELKLFGQTKQVIKKELYALLNEREEILKNIQNQVTYDTLFSKIKCDYSKELRSTQNLSANAERLLKEVGVIYKKHPPRTFDAKLGYYNILHTCNVLLENKQGIYHAIKSKIDLFQSRPSLLKEPSRQKRFFAELGNKTILESLLKKYDQMEQTINQMESYAKAGLQDNDDVVIARSFETISSMRLKLMLETSIESKNIIWLKDIQKNVSRHEKYLSPFNKMRLAYYLIAVLFVLNELDQALSWVKKIETYKKEERRNFLEISTSLIQIMIHIELENFMLVQSLLRSTKRLLVQKAGKLKSPFLIWTYLGKINTIINKQKLKTTSQVYQEKIYQLTNIQEEKELINNVLIIPYINYRLLNTSMQKETVKYFSRQSEVLNINNLSSINEK